MDKELRILILEDVPADAELEEHELRKAGLVFTSKVVDTREAFLRALDEFLPDLILSDYELPSFDGLAALRIAKEKCPDVPFILVTGKLGEEFAIEKLKEGATDYVLKNNLKRLVPSVERTLEEAKLITERKNIQDEIIKTKERLSFILNTAPVALYTSKASGDYGATFISGSIKGLLGYKPEDFTTNASFWADNIHPHDRERVFQKLPNIFKHGYHKHEYRFRHADGTYHWIHDEIKLIYDSNDNPLEIIGCWRDITKQKQSEDLLNEDKKNLASIFRAAPVGIGLVSSPDRIILRANERLCKMLGYSNEELVGKSARVLYPTDEDFEYVGKRKYELIKEHGVGTVETRWQCSDGRIIDVLLSSSPIDNNNLSLGVTFTVLNITDRKQAEASLKDRETFLHLQFNRMPIGCITWDVNFRVLSWNPAAGKIFGFTEEEATGKHPYDIIVPKDEQLHVDTIWQRLLEGDITAHSENENITKDGHTVTCYWVNTPFRKANGEVIGVISMVQDITERKKAEEALQASEAELHDNYFTQAAINMILSESLENIPLEEFLQKALNMIL